MRSRKRRSLCFQIRRGHYSVSGCRRRTTAATLSSDERINKVGETYRNLRNALRYQLSNLYDFDPASHSVPDEKLTVLDRWVLARFSALEQEAAGVYDRYEFHFVYQKISQFAAVELSAIYHDTVKDRLYTDSANSPRRRATQTVLHRMASGLCQMLSPILMFTADEAWEFIPGNRDASVHLATWNPSAFAVSAEERSDWARLFEIRERVLPSLEKERQAKVIGKALDARVTLTIGAEENLRVREHEQDSLRELLNVSQLVIRRAPAADANTHFNIAVTKAEGQKCERCWHWETDVGSDPAHPMLCGRCVGVVKAAG